MKDMEHLKRMLYLLVLVGLTTSAQAQTVVDPSRRVGWSQAGVVGGIPNRTTNCATFSPGATAAQINSAIASCPSGQVVFLNAGTYNLSAGLIFNGKSNVTLRGAGPHQTSLVFANGVSCLGLGTSICVKNNDTNDPSAPSHIANWTGGYAKGTTQITLSSTTGLAAGRLLMLDQFNDSNTDTGGIWICSTQNVCSDGSFGGAGRPTSPRREQLQVVRVTAVSGNTVTISPGLYMSNWRSSLSPGAWWSNDNIEGVGIEGLSLDHAQAGGNGITFMFAYNSWVRNVKSLVANRSHVWLWLGKNISIRDSYFYNSQNHASQSYGIELFQGSDNLVENNILHRITAPLIVNGGSSGSVFGYNYAFDMLYTVSPAWMIPSNNTHATGVDHILHEGNEGTGIIADIVHGSQQFLTIFRNRFTGMEPGKTAQTIPVHLYAFHRYMNVVGNVLGTAGTHTNYQSLPPSGSAGNASIYTLGWSGNGGAKNGSIANDALVATTMLRWGNYDTVSGASRFVTTEVPTGLSQFANPVPANQLLPASLYLSAKPGWWPGAIPWPPVGPDVTGGPGPGGHAYSIPAHVCYDNTPKVSGVLVFNPANCYSTIATPAAPTNLKIVP